MEKFDLKKLNFSEIMDFRSRCLSLTIGKVNDLILRHNNDGNDIWENTVREKPWAVEFRATLFGKMDFNINILK